MMKKKERTRLKILETAAEVFWLQSFQAVNVNRICALAQINKATLYQHYENKEALAVAAVGYHFERQKNEVYEAALAAVPGPLDRLSGIYQRIYQQHLSRHDRGESVAGCPFVNLASEMAGDSPAIRAAVAAAFEGFRSYYRLILRDARVIGYANRDPEGDRVISALQANMNGAMTAAKIENRPEAILEGLDSAKLILRG